jgi:hypothetical protein
MKRSVVIHQSTAWCRSHPATSRWTAGSVWRRAVGRGGHRGASATLPRATTPLPPLQPDQNAVGQHHRDSVPMKARPQAPLVLVPAPLPLGFCMKRLDRMPPMRHTGQLFERGLGRQVAPDVFPLLGLPTGGPLPQQPTLVALPLTRDPPTPHQPVVPRRQRMIRHCQRGTVWRSASARHRRLAAAFRSCTAKSVRTPTT